MEERRGIDRDVEVFSDSNYLKLSKTGVASIKCVQEGIEEYIWELMPGLEICGN